MLGFRIWMNLVILQNVIVFSPSIQIFHSVSRLTFLSSMTDTFGWLVLLRDLRVLSAFMMSPDFMTFSMELRRFSVHSSVLSLNFSMSSLYPFQCSIPFYV